jgi:vacuolar-type H+-ATPase subunit B/Vma2
MPKSNSQTGPGAMPGLPRFDIAPIIEANQRGLRAAAQANIHALQRMAKVNHELFGFVTRRLDHDRKAVKQLATCKSPQDALMLFSTFFETAMKQYSKEFAQFSAMYAEQTTEALADADHEIEETAAQADE